MKSSQDDSGAQSSVIDQASRFEKNQPAMEVKLAALADFASVSREGKVNILGLFDIINLAHVPDGLPMMFLVVVWEASAAEVGKDRNVTVTLLDDDGNQLMRLSQSVHVPEPPSPGVRPVINQIMGLAGLKFPKAGAYAFSILADEDEKKSISFRVNEIPAQEESEGK